MPAMITELSSNMVANVQKIKTYADAEALYMLDGARSVTRLHAHNDHRAVTAKKQKGEEIVVDDISGSDLSSSLSKHATDDDVSMDSSNQDKKKLWMEEVEAGREALLR